MLGNNFYILEKKPQETTVQHSTPESSYAAAQQDQATEKMLNLPKSTTAMQTFT